MTRYNHGDTIPFKVRAEDDAGNPISNANMVIRHYRAFDDKYFNGTTWQTAIFDIPMIPHTDTTNHKGRWDYLFDTTPHEKIDDYTSEMVDLSGNAKNAPFEIIESPVGGYLDSIVDSLKEIAGLGHKNFVMQPTDYSVTDKVTEGDVYVYDTKANADIDGRSIATGLIHKYHFTAPRDPGTDRALKFTQTEEVIS